MPSNYTERFKHELSKPATNALDSIIMVTTRATGITAAAGTRLPSPYSPYHLKIWQKFLPKRKEHLGFPHHASAHCGVFGTAARRSAGVLVSVPLWGEPLPWPLLILDLVSRYLTNSLIRHRPIVERITAVLAIILSQ